ncbi:branched-chain amino acid ABC transporter permease [Treponema socranskii]|uniref:branched-chain amino acid ABC transporter permease n=1 Tax=Treponema socranskii TaxID=53419 RepID=UPI0028ECFFB0|nr:branched-chain amino acid ABC transporter permease [Treponema socranskii]
MSAVVDTLYSVNAWCKKHVIVTAAVLIAVMLALPQIYGKSYFMGVMCRICLYALLAGALNIINGYSGMTCLGAAGFFCVGAYTEAILSTRAAWNFWLALPVAGIVTAVIGLLVALPTLKMSGIYLSIVTLGFSEIARLIALNWTALTGGALGIKGIPIPQFFGIAIRNPRRYYYVFLGFAILFLFVSHRVINSRIGRAWMSIRENELAAKSLGVDSSRYKISNFMYGAFWIGVAGAIYAPYVRFIDSTYFTLDEGWNILSMVIIGGQGTLVGPVVGSIIVNFLTEVLRPIGQWRLVAYALLIIIMMWFRPQGLVGASAVAGNLSLRRFVKRAAKAGKTKGSDGKRDTEVSK